MSSEKTLEEAPTGNQALNFNGVISNALASANIPKSIMQFYINRPAAANFVAKAFAKKPVCITVIGAIGGTAVIMAAQLEAVYGAKFNLFVIDRRAFYRSDEDAIISELSIETNILIYDLVFAKMVENVCRRSDLRNLRYRCHISDSNPAQPSWDERGYAFQKWEDAARHLLKWRFEQMLGPDILKMKVQE